MSEVNQTSNSSTTSEPMVLAQANIPSAGGRGAETGVSVEATKTAQDSFTSALSTGKSVQDAVKDAVDQARQQAISKGMSEQQADALAVQIREELGARAQSLPAIQPAPVNAAGSVAAQIGVAQPAPAVTDTRASTPDARAATNAAVQVVNPLTPIDPLTAPSSVAAATSVAPAPTETLAQGPSSVDAGGGVGSSALGGFSRVISSNVGVDSGGSINLTGMIAPYLEQKVASGGGLVTALANRFDIRPTSAAGGDPGTVQSMVNQIATVKSSGNQVGSGSVPLPVTDNKPPLEPSSGGPKSEPAPIRVPPFLDIEALTPTMSEAHEGFIELRYKVTRTGDLSEVDRVKWTATGLNEADLALVDAYSNGELVFQPREDSIEIVIRIASNRIVEADRPIQLEIKDPVNARLGPVTQATTTVLNDDSRYDVTRAPAQADVVTETSAGGGVPAVFLVTRTGNLSTASWVDYATGSSSELSANDFVGGLPSGRVSFTAGQSQAWVTLVVQPDQTIEPDEDLVFSLTGADYPALIVDGQATVTIRNDDVRFDVARASGVNPQILEGTTADGLTPVVFEVTKDGIVTTERTVRVTASGLDADDFKDNSIPDTVLTFAPGQSVQQITVWVKQDAQIEANETLVLTLSGESNLATVGSRTTSVVIENDDVKFDIAPAQNQASQVLEGTGAGPTAVEFKITKTGTVSTERTVKVSAGGLLTSDFVGNPANLPEFDLTFAAGETSKTVTLLIARDAAVEDHENLILSLSQPSHGATLGASQATVTIENDDVSWSVDRKLATVLEGTSEGGTTPVVFTVTKTGTVSSARTVDFAVSGLAGNDFSGGQVPAQTLTFAAGETSREITLLVNQDNQSSEGDENLLFSLSNASHAGTITKDRDDTLVYNDDLSVSVTAVESTVRETDQGQETLMVFRVARTEGLNERSVDWAINLAGINTADLGPNFAPSGKVTFAPGQTETFITLRLPGNNQVNTGAAPQATMTLSAPTNGMKLGQSSQTITVSDNDVYFGITADQVSTTEGYAGETNHQVLVFTVSRETANAGSDTVQWRVAPSSDTNVADFGSGQDVLANAGLPSGTVSFTGSQTSAKITLTLAGDDWFGAHETVLVELSNPSRGAVKTGLDQASSQIVNDDAPYAVAIVGDATKIEGSDSASAAQFVFKVTRPGGSALDARELLWSVKATGSLDPAASANDFAPDSAQLPSGVVAFTAGQTDALVTIQVKADSLVEGSESFVLAIADTAETQNTTITVPLSAQATIVDDDAAYRIDATSAIFLEGSQSGATQAFVFQVSREGYLGNSATVTWNAKPLLSGLTVNAEDFATTGQTLDADGMPTGQVNFSAGQSTATLTVLVAADALYEPNETFQVSIGASNPAGMNFTKDTAQGLIFNDEIGLEVVAVDASRPEGDSTPGAWLVFAVNRLGIVQSPSTVDWRVVADNAAELLGNDFVSAQNNLANTTLPSGTLSFTAGEASRLITLLVAHDLVMENNEGFVFQLSNASTGSHIVTGSATGTIVNDDSEIQIDPATPASVDEGNGGSQPLIIRVLRDGSTVGEDTVAWSLSATGTHVANFPADISSATSGVLTFANGSSFALLTLQSVADSVEENNESFTLTLGATSTGAVLKPNVANAKEVTLVNDDSTVTLNAVTASANEGSAASPGVLVYEISRTGALRAGTVSFGVSSGNSPAVNGVDFAQGSLPSGTVSFTAGQTNLLLTLDVQGDYFNESDENLTVALTAVSPGQLLGSTVSQTGVIVNDDTGVSVAANLPSQVEGSVSGGRLAHEFTITRSGILSGETVVDYAVTGHGAAGFAVDQGDFEGGTLPAGSVTFAATETTKVVTVWTLKDEAIENNEGIRLTLTSASGNADIQQATADTQLLSDDSGLQISAQAASVDEGTLGVDQSVRFNVTRTGDLSKVSTVNWTLSGGLDANDLTTGALTSGTVTFTAGMTAVQVNLPVKGDTGLESDETMTVTLSGANAGSFILDGQNAASTLIKNDDDRLTLAATSTTVDEGLAGTSTPIVFTITRDAAGVKKAGTVLDWTMNSSMLKPNDFDLVGGLSQDRSGANGGLPSGSITFAQGQTAEVVTILVHGDGAVERNEAFTISVSTATPNNSFSNTPTAGAISVPGVVNNDDVGFSVEAFDAVVAEGQTLVNGVASGSGSPLVFSITRAGAENTVATVQYTLTGAADLTAGDIAGGFGALTTLTFTSGELIKFVTVMAQSDTTVEANEQLVMTLSGAANLTDPTATITVRNDDQIFDARVLGTGTSTTVQEGDASSTVPLVFEVVRTGDATGSSVVQYAVVGGAGVSSEDYQGALPSGNLTFTSGQTSERVTLLVNGDRIGEANEPYTLTLSNPEYGSVGNASATITVANDDTNYLLSPVSDVLEGTGGGANNYTFTVQRVGNASAAGSVNWALTARGSDELTAGDFVSAGSLPSGTVNFTANQTAATVTLAINRDANLETDEGMVITLSNPNQGTLEPGLLTQATAVIQSDDDQFAIARASGQAANLFEGNTGNTNVVFTVTRTGALRGERVVSYTASGTGISSADFDGSALSGPVTFAPGQSTANITMALKGDSSKEDQETLLMTLSSPTGGATLDTAATVAQVIIDNDDAQLSISAQNPSVNEASTVGGVVQQRAVVFTIARVGYEFQNSTFSYSATGVTADDFFAGVLPSGTLTFTNGETALKNLTLLLKADSVKESDENLLLSLTNPSVGTEISSTLGTATQTIENDDSEFNITAGTNSYAEGDAAHSTSALFTYTVTRSGSLSNAVSVDWFVSGTAAQRDFTTGTGYAVNQSSQEIRPEGSLYFASGQSSATVTVYAFGDAGRGSVEGNENFVLGLRNASDSSSVGAAGTYTSTIVDDDTLITATSIIRLAEEVAGQTTSYVYTLTRSGFIDRESTLNYAVSGHTKNDQDRWEYGAAANDFVGNAFPTGNVTFAVGETVKTITIRVQGDDDADENDQWFKIALTGTSGVDQINGDHDSGNNAFVLGEIKRDEAYFSIVNSATTGTSVYEGDSLVDGASAAANLAMAGNQRSHIFRVVRELSLDGPAFVNWAVGGGNTSYVAATASDFVGDQLPTGQVTFAEDQSEGFITIWTKADDVGEYEEDFRVYITSVSSGSSFRTEDNSAYNENRVVLLNDDTRFDITQGATVTEGASFVLTITRSGDTRGSDIAQWAVSFTGAENSNESSGTTTTWYKLDPADLGANAVDAVSSESMNPIYDSANKRLTGEVLFLNGESTRTITISTIDDNLTETWRELLPTSISSNSRNVTGSLLSLSGTFAQNDVISLSIDGNAVSYPVTAANIDGSGNSETTYRNILSGLAEAINDNDNGTVAALATARIYDISPTVPGLFIEDDSHFATASFVVTASQTSAAGTVAVVAEVAPDREIASPGYQGSQWVLDNEPDLVTVSQNVASRYENTSTSDQTVVFTLTRTNNAATGDLNYPTTIAWRVDGTDAYWDIGTIAGTNSVVTYEKVVPYGNTNTPATSYSPNAIFGLTSFTSGQTTASVTLTIAADTSVETDDNFVFSLVDAQTAYNYWITEHTYSAADSNGRRTVTSTYDVQAWGNDRDSFGPANVNMAAANSKTTFTVLSDDIYVTVVNLTDVDPYLEVYDGKLVAFENSVPVLTLKRAGVLDSTVVIGYEKVNGATEVGDFFGGASGNLTLTAQANHFGDATYTFTLANFFNDDASAEGHENYWIRLTGPADVQGNHVRFNTASNTTDVPAVIYDDDTDFSWTWVTNPIALDEGNNGSGQFTPLIANMNRSAGYMGPASVAWSLAPGYTVQASDFSGDILPSGSMQFGNGVTQQSVTLLIRQDLVVESGESFALRLTGATLTDLPGTVNKNYNIVSTTATIYNDDTGLSIGNASVTEVDDGANSSAVFTITRTGSIDEISAVTWQVTTTGGAGNAGSTDFVETSGTVNFVANQVTATVTVAVKGDNDAESDESFRLQITGATNVEDTSYQSNPGNGTILNDDSAFSIVANQAQGALESAAHTFTITRTHSTAQNQVVAWQLAATSTGDDANSADFTGGLVGGNVTFSAGVLSQTITLPVINDSSFEFNEAYQVNLSLGTGTTGDTLTVSSALGKVLNDDTAFGIVVDTASRMEGAGDVVYTVTRVGDLTGTSTVQFALTSGSGITGADFSASLPANQVLTFTASESTRTFTIAVSNDNDLESAETLTATLANATGAGLISNQSAATVTLLNDDAAFTLSHVSGALQDYEGSGTPRDVVLRVTRTGYLDSSGTVAYAVSPSGGDASADFATGLTGSLLFTAGQTESDITLTVVGDLTQENDESYTVALSTSSSGFAVNASSTQTLTLLNDDTRFDLSATGATTVTEKDPGDVAADVPVVFRVDRTGRTTAQQVVTWTVEGQGADGAGAADFVATTGTVTFAANAVGPQNFTVYAKADYEGEADEGFKVTISNPDLQFGTSAVTTGVIVDDEASFSVRRHEESGSPVPDAFEGQSGSVALVFDVIRAGNIASTTSTVSWSAVGDADVADYVDNAVLSGQLTFTNGEALKTVTVVVKGDSAVELDERVILALSNPSPDADVVDAKAQATITVRSDDTSWSLESVSNPSVESDTSSGHVYRVVRTGGLYDTSIGFSVAGVNADAAAANDFVGGNLPTGTLSFTAGQLTSALFTIQVAGDSLLEANESFAVILGTPVADATPRTNVIPVQSLTSTIVNDDDVMSVTAVSTAATEPDTAGSNPVTFTIHREGSLTGESTVGWQIRNSTTAGESNQADFVTPTGTVTFANGQSVMDLTLQVKGDMDVEVNEAFVLELVNPGAGSTLSTTQPVSANGTIANNDIDLHLSAVTGQANEGDTVPGTMVFKVTRTGLLTGTTTVDYAIAGTGTSQATSDDFASNSPMAGSLTFAANETEALITVVSNPDGAFEASETYLVSLSGASGNAQIEVAAVTGTITNDDDQLEVVPHAATVAEGTNLQITAYTDFVFQVNRTGSAIGDASATWTVTPPSSGRTLTVPNEVSASTGTVSFTDGQSSAMVTIKVLADTLGEYNENFLVTLSSPSFGSTLIGSPAQGTVQNDDPVLSITANQATQVEGNSEAPDSPFVFTVTRTGNTTGASTAKWQVSGVPSGSSADPVDFGGYMPSGLVVFTAGQVTQTLTVMVLADVAGELNEGFLVTLFEPTGADLLDERLATMHIVNDDTLVSIAPVITSVAEGAESTTVQAAFVLTREGNINQVSTVDWRVQGVSTQQVNEEDFVAGQDTRSNGGLPSGVASFSVGQSTATVWVQVDGDANHAPDEMFRVALSAPSVGAVKGDPATFTVLNDDALISLDTTPQLASEGGALQFAVTRTGTGLSLSSEVVVRWTATGYGESAASSGDLSIMTGLVTFAANATAALITLQAQADNLVERDEQFRMTLTEVTSGNASFNPTAFVAHAAVTDEDVGVWVSAVRSQALEGSQVSGQTPFVVEVMRTGRLDQVTSLNLSVSGGTSSPTSADDFAASAMAVTFAANVTSQLVTLSIQHDANSEVDESFVVRIDQGAGYTVIGEPVYGTVMNDDGTSGADVLYGSAGDDVLRGGDGNDVMFGQGGADRFVFDAPSYGKDTVMDFSVNDTVVFKSTAFGNLTANTTSELSGTLDAILASLSSASGGDPDFVRLNVTGEFQFASGVAGHLDEIESAISAGQATGAGFVAIAANNSNQVHLYYDADMSSGTNGTGLQEIAVLQGIDNAHHVQLAPGA
ncbi:Calx-beta domain-containing protein [Limnohabitans sp. DCL3]|uniref:Calx-beta domain-containing protein n=1 Tax=Limnohabitans sp. DCL3 TaxID=3374103 RepID=UPI003A8375A2